MSSQQIKHENPLCSVCIANYNGGKIIDKCIDSILLQSEYAGSVEIIVHDDASTDNSVALIKDKYPQVRLLCSETNVGFCLSNNRMVEVALGTYVLLLNNDAALWPDSLGTLIRHARSQDRQGILTLPQYDWQSREIVDRGCLLDPFYNPVPNLDPDRKDVAMVVGACLWIPRKLWQELGGFPAWLESIAEDALLCCNARIKGYPVQVTADSGYWHEQGKSFGGNRADSFKLLSTYRRRRFSERNKTYLLCLFTPIQLLVPLMFVHIMLLFFEGLVLSIIKWNKRIFVEIYYNVIVCLVKNKKNILNERLSTQSDRKCSSKSYYQCFTFKPRKLMMLFKHGIPGIK